MPATSRQSRRPTGTADEARAELPLGATRKRIGARPFRTDVQVPAVFSLPPCVLATIERLLTVSGQFLLATDNRPGNLAATRLALDRTVRA